MTDMNHHRLTVSLTWNTFGRAQLHLRLYKHFDLGTCWNAYPVGHMSLMILWSAVSPLSQVSVIARISILLSTAKSLTIWDLLFIDLVFRRPRLAILAKASGANNGVRGIAIRFIRLSYLGHWWRWLVLFLFCFIANGFLNWFWIFNFSL